MFLNFNRVSRQWYKFGRVGSAFRKPLLKPTTDLFFIKINHRVSIRSVSVIQNDILGVRCRLPLKRVLFFAILLFYLLVWFGGTGDLYKAFTGTNLLYLTLSLCPHKTLIGCLSLSASLKISNFVTMVRLLSPYHFLWIFFF